MAGNSLIVVKVNAAMKRITVFKNGSSIDGALLGVPSSMCQLLAEAGRKLGISGTKIFSDKGAIIDDVNLLRDDDVVYLSRGETFKNVAKPNLQSKELTGDVMEESFARELKPVSGGDWITLNVGGRYFSTTRSTLTSKEGESMLARMFASNESYVWQSCVDPNGAYLIDRSPTYFEPILNYLRHGELVMDKNVNPKGVLEEARFFGIISLVELLEARIKDQEPPSDSTPITRRDFVFKLMTTPPEWELRCQGMNFTGANLSKLDLRHINFKYAVLRGANLSGANLSYCNFERADLSKATFNGANLLGVKMLCVNLDNAIMHGCNFEDPAGSRANMEGANMKHVDLEGSHMAGVNLRVATLKNANLQNCDLRGAVLAGADLENCDLSGCDLQEANLRGANLKGFRLALIQLAVGASKADNLLNAVKHIKTAAAEGAKIVALPECCNCPYGNNFFPEYAEPIPGPAIKTFAQAAQDNKVFLVAGSIPEKSTDGKLYNTCTIFNPEGELIAKHRKIHLFDIDIPGKITFQESKTLSPGSQFTTFQTPFCKVGVGICYDIRFSEMAQIYRKRGCDLLLYPGAFNMTTGEAHWEKIQVGRAIDNQLYVATISPARDESASYVAWGHSTCVNPWGEIIGKADESEQIVYADIDLDFTQQVRQQVPISMQRREDLYIVDDKKS